MSTEKNEQIKLQVTEGLSVAVIPNSNHEFLLSSNDVATGFGVSKSTIREHQRKNAEELHQGKHFVKGVSIPDTLPKGTQPHAVYWTKRGIVRLGFFIKSEQARLFRDWAEELVLGKLNKPAAKLPGKGLRNHNRLSSDRLVGIMADVAKIDNKDVRLSLTEKLLGGFDYGEV